MYRNVMDDNLQGDNRILPHFAVSIWLKFI